MRPPLTTTLDEALDILRADGRDHGRPVDWRYGVRHAVSIVDNALAAQPAPPTEALRLLRELAAAWDSPASDAEHSLRIGKVWVEARRYLAATEETP